MTCGARLETIYKDGTRKVHFVGSAEVFEGGTVVELEEGDQSQGILDTGCRRTVAGSEWITRYTQALYEVGLTAEWENDPQSFRFGNQGVLHSTKTWSLPVAFYEVDGILKVCKVPGGCPLLISEESMKVLDISMRLGRDTIDIGALSIYGQPRLRRHGGHPVVNLFSDDGGPPGSW